MPKRSVHETWPELDDDALLELRMADLPLAIQGTLAQRTEQLRDELHARGLTFPLHFYLSDEWFTPDGATAIAIPFYLAHSRLEKLEDTQMLEVEGGEYEWCMRILRHEAGHAIDNAYRLRRRARRREIFGSPAEPYPEFYTPKPYSKSFVLHLDSWYAQSHPDEDFAETFAVWLTPDSDWRTRYVDWPALNKLQYMETLMNELMSKPMLVRSRRKVEPIQALKKTLRAHYERKRRHYGLLHPHFYDRDLRKLFSDGSEHARNIKAARFIARVRRDVRRMVAEWTGEYQYTIDQVIEDMIRRAAELNLRLKTTEEETR